MHPKLLHRKNSLFKKFYFKKTQKTSGENDSNDFGFVSIFVFIFLSEEFNVLFPQNSKN